MTEEQKQKLKEIENIQSELSKMKENNANNNIKGLCSIANILEKDNTPKEEFLFRRECKEPVMLIENNNKIFPIANNTLNNNNSNNNNTDPGLNYFSNYNLINPTEMQYFNYNNPYLNANLNCNNLSSNLMISNPMFNNDEFNYHINSINPYMMQPQLLIPQNMNENDRILNFAEKIQENYVRENNVKTTGLNKEFDKIVDTGKLLFLL